MLSEDEIRAAATNRGLRTKSKNLLAAALSGSVLAIYSYTHFPHSIIGILSGLVAGFIYANGFEYVLHRFLLHSGHGIFAGQHMVHHTTWNAPEAARYVNFSSNPWGVVALFFANAVPFLIFQWIYHNGWVAGVFASFAIYYAAFEEIHWRTHMGGWLPEWLRPAARHHLLHHVHDTERFNVFLPLFDRLLEGLLPRARISRQEAGK
jgi:hypothetical protein